MNFHKRFAWLAAAAMLPNAGLVQDAAEGTATLRAAYTGDVWYNARGGLRRGTAYLDNLDVTLEVGGGRAFGIPGLTLFAYGLYNNDRTFSDRYVGDAMVVSNIDVDGAFRLYELWADVSFGKAGAFSLRAGLYDLNSEFDATEARGLFINSSHGIGQELAQTGENGPSIFPSTSLAARLAWTPHERLTFRIAALDGVPGDPDDPDCTCVSLSGDDGALLIGEGTAMLGAGRYSIGHWQYTRDSADGGTYINAEIPMLANSGDENRGLVAFARAGVANGRINAFDRYYSAGLVQHDVVLGSRRTELGLAVAATRTSKPYRRLQRDLGVSSDDYEYNVELTWRIPLTNALVLQPDIQYIVNPGADSALDDALALGLRFEWSGGMSLGN